MRSPVTCFLLFTLSASAQELAFEKYRLENGMQVILHEDHSLPVVCVNIWYGVGSGDEAPGRSGFAHLFEHLMFMGTERTPGSSFDDWMEAGGGWNNASTSKDRTNYFSVGPSNLLPLLLWLEADRLEALGSSMTQEKLDRQREVVRNERRENTEMRPYGRAYLEIDKLMYPPGHPYHTSVIGSHEHLEAATLKDVKDFFARYYVPNNASLVVAGDFDPQDIKPRIAAWFGTLPRRPEVPRKKMAAVELREVRRLTLTDRVQFPRISIIYHSPPFFAPGDAAMDLVAAILAGGKSSRLYERLVYTDKLATEVSAYQASRRLGSLFHIVVTARPGVSLDRIEGVVDEELGEFLARGPSEDELERRKAALEYESVSALQSLRTKADRLNLYNFHLGTPNGFRYDLDRYRRATTDTVRKWAIKMLNRRARLILRVLPEPKVQIRPRAERPDSLATKPFLPQAPEVFELSNGLEVRHWERRELPLVRVSLLVKGGASLDPPGKAGVCRLTADMLDEGAAELGALEFTSAMERLGASFTVATGRESVRVNLQALTSKLEPALALCADAVLRPRFDDGEWQRVKRLHLEALRQAEDRPSSVARLVGMRAFFGDDHSYGRPIAGSEATVKDLTVKDLVRCYGATFFPGNAKVFIAGDLGAGEAKAALEKAFGAWRDPAGAVPAQTLAEPAPRGPHRVVLVDKPEAVQTVVRFYMPGPSFAHPERSTYKALNTVLGGSFTSRLNQNLREKHGYTYGAASSFVMTPRSGYFVAAASVQAKHTAASIREFLAELDSIRTGNVTEEEAGKARATNRQEVVQSLQGLRGLLEAAITLELGGLPFAALGSYMEAVEKVSAADINELGKRAIPLEHAVLVLVGSKRTILAQIGELQLPTPVELSVHGEPVSR